MNQQSEISFITSEPVELIMQLLAGLSITELRIKPYNANSPHQPPQAY